jgi:hypothetical protein
MSTRTGFTGLTCHLAWEGLISLDQTDSR